MIPRLVMVLMLLAAPAVATEFWEGSYDCAQGRTGLTLTLEEATLEQVGSPGQVAALFNFYAVPENPRVPTGCFEMSGLLDRRTRLVDLRAGRWLLRPFTYVAVDMRGTFDADFTRLTGHIAGPGCTGFVLRRVAAPTHPAPAACRPAALTS